MRLTTVKIDELDWLRVQTDGERVLGRALALLENDRTGSVTCAALRERGVRAPAQAVYDLQLAGFAIDRITSTGPGGRTTSGYRPGNPEHGELDQNADRPGARPRRRRTTGGHALHRLWCGEQLHGKAAERIRGRDRMPPATPAAKMTGEVWRERRYDTMVNPRHITITVRYDRQPSYGRSLQWIAPELGDSALTMTEDQLDDPTPSRTWAGVVDGPTYERFAEAWRLPKDTDETTSQIAGDDRELVTHSYTLDGMNWEAGNESPIVCVSLQVMQPARPQ